MNLSEDELEKLFDCNILKHRRVIKRVAIFNHYSYSLLLRAKMSTELSFRGLTEDDIDSAELEFDFGVAIGLTKFKST